MSEYRIEDLARSTGTTVRNIRAYQDRGLLPKPSRRGRVNVYDDDHLARLRQIAGLLERGYTLASIKELLDAWDSGRGLDGVLELLAEVDRPWSDETPARLTHQQLAEAFGAGDAEAVAEAVSLGVLEPDEDGGYLVPSPQLLSVVIELHAAGVPLAAVSGHLRELRAQVEHIARRFVDFAREHVFQRCEVSPPTDSAAARAAELVRRMRPLARQSVDVELARAMRTLATRHLQHALGSSVAYPGPYEPTVTFAQRPHGSPADRREPRSATPPSPGQVRHLVLDLDHRDAQQLAADALPPGVELRVTIPEETASLLRVLLERAAPGPSRDNAP
ncbi:MerR family transcriptional regulator [Wenjunlia vitaminophila]|uniref:MerR family transcriptional regulator n=1 Tax=Wenjunlia vitaminophila TaxID=76728 RepID=UPI000A789CBC|nr:MerR family transcriptional regulator [Wenjunlia vitaminophila]